MDVTRSVVIVTYEISLLAAMTDNIKPVKVQYWPTTGRVHKGQSRREI